MKGSAAFLDIQRVHVRELHFLLDKSRGLRLMTYDHVGKRLTRLKCPDIGFTDAFLLSVGSNGLE